MPAKGTKKSLSPQIDVKQAVADFYIVLMAEPLYNPETTHAARMDMFNRVKARVIPGLANAFFDYIVAACAGEGRHAEYRCHKYYKGYPNTYDKDGGESSRGTAAKFVLEYEPRSLLKALQTLFNKDWRDSSFGGESWSKIAGSGLLYKTIPDMVFVDHCVDLSHNSGNFLDKGMIFSCSSRDRYVRILESKKYAKGIEDFAKTLQATRTPVSDDVLPLVTRLAGNDAILQLIDMNASWEYQPITWGTKPFDLLLVGAKIKKDEDGNESDELEAYDESTEEKAPSEPEAEEYSARRDA
jgi:hypothetical protein